MPTLHSQHKSNVTRALSKMHPYKLEIIETKVANLMRQLAKTRRQVSSV